MKLRKETYIIIMAITIIYIAILTGCTPNGNGEIIKNNDKIEIISAYIDSNYMLTNPYGNTIKHYCIINGKHYFDLNLLSIDGTMNKIADNIPYGNPFNASINGIATDGEYLYCHAWNLQINEYLPNERRSGLYKIDVNNKTVELLYEWETPSYINNNYSIVFEGEYIYFFIPVSNTNDLCRIKKDGTNFEKLTNNDGNIYTGIFFVNDQVFYHKDGNLYKTVINDIDNGILVYENLYTIELYKGYFYCTTSNEKEFIRFRPDDPTAIELLINDMCKDFYIIKDDIIYYAIFDPVTLVKNSQGLETRNSNQGQIYTYDINTRENKKFFQNSDICFYKIYNISNTAVIAQAVTNTKLIDSAEQGGMYMEYYIIPLDGRSEYHQITDLTLELIGK